MPSRKDQSSRGRRRRQRRGDDDRDGDASSSGGSSSDTDSTPSRSESGRRRRRHGRGESESGGKKKNRYGPDGELAKGLDPVAPSSGRIEEGAFDTRFSLVDNIATLVEKEKAVLQLQLEEKEAALRAAEDSLRDMKEKMKQLGGRATAAAPSPPPAAPAAAAHMFLLANLRDDAAAHADEARLVERLDLAGQPVQSAQLDTLQRRLPYLKSIVAIDLSRANLTDALGAPGLLAQLLGARSRVRALHLQHNALGAESFRAICSALPHNTALNVLEVQHNPFGREPKVGQQLANALRGARGSQLVHLGVTLADAIHVNGKRGVTYVGNPHALLSAYANGPLHAVQALALAGANVTPRSIEAFRKHRAHVFKSLTALDMSHAFVGPVGCYHLCEAVAGVRAGCTLTSLDLSYNRLGCDGAVSVGKLVERNRSLTALHARCNQIRGKGAAALARSLERAARRPVGSPVAVLALGGNPIDKAGARALLRAAEACPNLQDFGLDALAVHVGTKARIRATLDENRRGGGGGGAGPRNEAGIENVRFVRGEDDVGAGGGRPPAVFAAAKGKRGGPGERRVQRVGLYILGRPAPSLA